MTIRFTCAECASVLKIKEELAGTKGRCPKCKTPFVVPGASTENGSVSEESPESQLHSQPTGSKSGEHPTQTLPPVTSDVPDSQKDPAAMSEPTLSREHSHGDAQSVDSTAKSDDVLSDDEIDETSDEAEKPPELSLDDRDGEMDENPSVKAPEVKHSSVGITPSVDSADDDEDLDSPSMFISSFMPKEKSTEDTSEQKQIEKPRTAFESFEKSSKSASASRREIPFDPTKFLMNDPVSPKSDPHLSKSDVYAVKDELDSDLSLSDPDDPDDPGDSDAEISTRPTPHPHSRPTPHPISRPAPKASASRSTPEKVDLEAAAKMMKKAIKDSQAEAAHQRALDEKGGYDYFLFLREFGIRGAAVLVGGIIMTFGLYFVGQMVFGSSLSLPKLGYVSGTVTLDGKPLPNATVYFAPTEPPLINGKQHNARTSMGTTDEKGHFKMIYIDRTEGVAAGKCRVWVKHMSEKGNDVPTEWMELALRTEEVAVGHQKGPFDIKMESKKKK